MARRTRARRKDYYSILGLQKGCSEAQLKKAYRKLALKFHPVRSAAPPEAPGFAAGRSGAGPTRDRLRACARAHTFVAVDVAVSSSER